MLIELSRQQLCAALGISESTVRRLELQGLPYTPVGLRAKRYNLAECKAWLRANQHQIERPKIAPIVSRSSTAKTAFSDACRKMKLRVLPSP